MSKPKSLRGITIKDTDGINHWIKDNDIFRLEVVTFCGLVLPMEGGIVTVGGEPCAACRVVISKELAYMKGSARR